MILGTAVFRKLIRLFLPIFIFLSPAYADISDFIAPLLPGDIIFSKGEISQELEPRFGAHALHGHLSIYLGRKDDFSKYLRPDQIKKYIKNWRIKDYNPVCEIKEDDILVFDIYPEPYGDNRYVRFLKITSGFFIDPAGKKYPFPITESQRGKIIQFLFDKIEVPFDVYWTNDEAKNSWTCDKLCEFAYANAGVSILKLFGITFQDMTKCSVNYFMMGDRSNRILINVLVFYLLDFITVEVSNNFSEDSGIKYYAVKLVRGNNFYNNGESDNIIRIRHDVPIVNIFCDLFGFKQTIAGPFDTEKETVAFITNDWDENYGYYLSALKLNR